LRARSLQVDADLSGELLDEVRAGVVPRPRIGGARIAETGDDVAGARAAPEHYSEDSAAASPSGAASPSAAASASASSTAPAYSLRAASSSSVRAARASASSGASTSTSAAGATTVHSVCSGSLWI